VRPVNPLLWSIVDGELIVQHSWQPMEGSSEEPGQKWAGEQVGK